MIEASEAWKVRCPGAVMGFMVMRGAGSPAWSPALEELCRKVEAELRERFQAAGREALRALPVMSAYESWYRQFRKTYHVALQLESVIWKGRRIESKSPLVRLMFMAELSNMLLTAVHDLGRVTLPLRIGVGEGTEQFVGMGGERREIKEGDMMVSDARGIISSIICGPDQRTAVNAETNDLLFAVYAPSGIGTTLVRAHLGDIQRYVELAAPAARVETLEILSAE